MGFLPTTVKEMRQLGWDYVDIVLFSGDAYIDHPSFGTAVVSRLFEDEGLRVAVVPQPNWRDDLRDFKKFGTPRLCFCVTAGVMDSMVNHYTANKRLRCLHRWWCGRLPPRLRGYDLYEDSQKTLPKHPRFDWRY